MQLKLAMEQFPGSGSSSSTVSSSFDVFLSFRGPDTRRSFTDVLYNSLNDAGIRVFRDKEEIPVGHSIHSTLIQAIRRSKISIPIFSNNFAFSKSCLMEVAEMVECRRAGDHAIIPIFYDVEPSAVKDQTQNFGEALRKHKRNGVNSGKIEEWKQALREIGELGGLELACYEDGHYSKLIGGVVSCVLKMLKKVELVIPENILGLDHHVEEMMRELDVASNDVRVVGIHGISGIGKTTLAKVVYNKLCHSFEYCSFIENVSEFPEGNKGLKQLQRQLASDLLKKPRHKFSSYNKGAQFMKNRFGSSRVLLLLDDVDNLEQLKALLWVGGGYWFDHGSKIIVTTKWSDVLDLPMVHAKYEVPLMGNYDSLQLFWWHAFGGLFPRNGYQSLSDEIVSITGGLPLALEIVGSCLFGKTEDFWEGTLEKLKERPHEKISEKLMISYEYLEEEQRKIFLDIACFFIGKDKRFAFYMWEDCKFYPKEGIGKLIFMSLVKIGDNSELWMHSQLRDLGRQIVRMENTQNPGKRSRLWKHEDAFSTLKKKKGTKKVEALSLNFKDECCSPFTYLEFDYLSNLRFLKLDQANITGGLNNCLSTLSWLDWEGCSKAADLLNFHLERLAILDLSSSQVSQDGDSWDQIMKMAKKLKVLNLKHCVNLRGSLSFPVLMALEMLILESCFRLMQIDPSIGNVKELKTLNLKFCSQITFLPEELMGELKELLIDGTSIKKIDFPEGSMKKLEILSARGCKSLDQISDSIGSLRSLTELSLDESLIQGLPTSIGNLVKLQHISLRNCQNLHKLPDSVGDLKLLVEVDLSDTSIKELPSTFENLKSLKVLKMESCFLQKFPHAIMHLEKLEEIDFSLCRSMSGEISFDSSVLSSLRTLKLSSTQISGITSEICQLSRLQVLDLLQCSYLQGLPLLPPSLVCLQVGSGSLHVAPDISRSKNLRKLHLALAVVSEDNPDTLTYLKWTSLSKLEALHITVLRLHQSFLELSHSTALPLSLHQSFLDLSKLRELSLSQVKLSSLRQLPSGLSILLLQHCEQSGESPDLSNLSILSKLEVLDSTMATIHGLERLEALNTLIIRSSKIGRISGLEHLSNLRVLTLSDSDFLESLPDITHLKRLEKKEIEFCRFVDRRSA